MLSMVEEAWAGLDLARLGCMSPDQAMKRRSPLHRLRRSPSPAPLRRAGEDARGIALALLTLFAFPAHAADLTLELVGTPTIVYDSAHDGCTPDDFPDLNARAFRDAGGRTVMFALHDRNRPLVGPDLAHLKPDCHAALVSPADPDPAHYADRNFVAATWTDDGRTVAALVHHEYHADQFGRCTAQGDLACWYNTVLAYRSRDGGLDFSRVPKPVVAAAPFRQDFEQGRHRGFFNPSNIIAGEGEASRFRYALISTTGWDGQPYGNCLFRTLDPAAGGWRAWDGHGFTIRYDDPYRPGFKPPQPCRTLAPFTFPVGSVVLHMPTHTFVALFAAKAGGIFPLAGFYSAMSRDLLHWGEPRLVLAVPTLYDDLCRAGPSIVAYPAILDAASAARNYDTIGDAPELFFTRIAVEGCATGRRLLLRQRLAVRPGAPS